MQLSQQPVRIIRRGLTAAATVGLTAMMVMTATPARSATAPFGAMSPGRPCVNADAFSVDAIVEHGGDCPSAGVSATTGPDESDETDRVSKESKRGSKAARPGRHVIPRPIQRPVCGPPYVENNPLLGPVRLPRTGYFGTLLFGYIRYGGLTPSQFLAKYRTPTGWIFPPDDGFERNSSGTLLRFQLTLYPGQYIDRFGNEFGRFLGAGGSPFIARSLPPDSLNTAADDPVHVCNYHLYRVLKAFDVDGGPAAPWFEQPGGGLQYAINSAYLPAGAQAPFIPWLVDHGYLQRVY
jgi:hypothetical protein